MYIKLSPCIQAGLWIAIVFFSTVVMEEQSSDSTIQPSREFSPTAVKSSSTIQDRTSKQSSILQTSDQQSLEISPTRTLQTFSVQGNSVVMSGTHVQASSFTPLIISHSTDTVYMTSSIVLFQNQFIDSSIKTSDAIVENEESEPSVASLSALVMTTLSTNIDTSESIVPVSLITHFNELSSSIVFHSNSESERSDIVSDFNIDSQGTESNTLKSLLTDSLISKSVIINITSSRTYSHTANEMVDISSSSIMHPSLVLSSDDSVILQTSSEIVNEIITQTVAVLSSNLLDSSLSVDQNVTENSFLSPVFNTDMTGKSNYESISRMSISQLVTPQSDSFHALTSSNKTKYSYESATAETATRVDPQGKTIAIVTENSSQSASSFYIDQIHSLSELFVSKSHNHVFELLSSHVSLIPPSFITNSVFDSMQTFYSTSMDGTSTKDSKMTTAIGINQPTTTYIPAADTTVYSEQTLSTLMSLSSERNAFKESTTHLSSTTNQILTGILTSLLDIQSYRTSGQSSSKFGTKSVDQFSSSVFKSSITAQQLTWRHTVESTARYSANDLSHTGSVPPVTSSIHGFSTKMLHATSSKYYESFLSTVYINVTQIQTSASGFVTESVESNHTQILSNYTQSNTVATRFATEVSEMLSSHVTTFITAQNTFDSTKERLLNSDSSSLQSLALNISPTPTEHINFTDESDLKMYRDNSTKSSITDNSTSSVSTEHVEEITSTKATSNRSTNTGTGFSTLTSSYSNDAISLTSATESLRNREQYFTLLNSAEDISTTLQPTEASAYSVFTSDSSDLNSQSRTGSFMNMSKLTSDMISSDDENLRDETTLKSIFSTWSSNSFPPNEHTDIMVSLPAGDSFKSIDSMLTNQQSASSSPLFETKSTEYPSSSNIFNSADKLSSLLIHSVISSTYPSFESESLTSRSSTSTLDISESYSKTNESKTKVSDVSLSSYSHSSISISATDVKSVIPLTTIRHNNSIFPRTSAFSLSSDQLVSTSYNTPEKSTDKISSIPYSYSKTDILSANSNTILEHTSALIHLVSSSLSSTFPSTITELLSTESTSERISWSTPLNYSLKSTSYTVSNNTVLTTLSDLSSIDLNTSTSVLSKYLTSDSYIASPTSPFDSKQAYTFPQSPSLSTLSTPSVVTTTNYTSNTLNTGLYEFVSTNLMSIEPSPATMFSGISEGQSHERGSHPEFFGDLTSSDLLKSNVFTTTDLTSKLVTTISIKGSPSLVSPRSSEYTAPELYLSTSYTPSEQTSNELDSISTSRSSSEYIKSKSASSPSTFSESSLSANSYSMIISSITISLPNIPTDISNLLITSQDLTSKLVTQHETVSSFPTLSSSSSTSLSSTEYSTYFESDTSNTTTSLTNESFSLTPMSVTTSLSFRDIKSTPSNEYTNVSTLPDLSKYITVTASTGQTTVSLISEESSVTSFIAKSASTEINSLPSYTYIYQTQVDLSSTFPSTITELLSTESTSERISWSTPLNYSLKSTSYTVSNNTVLTTLSDLSIFSIVSTTSNMVTLQGNTSLQSLFASVSMSSIETNSESNTSSTQPAAFENSQLRSSPLFSFTSHSKTSSIYISASNSYTDIPNVIPSSELPNTVKLTSTNQPVTSQNEEFSTSFISTSSTYVSSSDMYHLSPFASSKHSTVDPSATTTDLLSSERISSTFSDHSITTSSISSDTKFSVPSNSNSITNIAPTRAILPTASFVTSQTSTFVKHEGNVSLESPFSISSTTESSINLVIKDSSERLTIESTHSESLPIFSVSSYMDKSETDNSATYRHTMITDLLVSSYISNTLSTISTDQWVTSSKTIINEEFLVNITSKSTAVRSPTDLSPSEISLVITSSGLSTLSLPPSTTKLTTESYAISDRISSSVLLSGSTSMVYSSIIPSPVVFNSSLPGHSIFSTNFIIISPTSSVFTKQESVSQSPFSNLSTSSMRFSNSASSTIFSQITKTNIFSAITETVFDSTKSQLSSPVTHVSITSSSLIYSTNYNDISITSTGNSLSSEDSLIYTGTTPAVSETFSTISSMLVTSEHVQTMVDYSSVWSTVLIKSGEVSDSTSQLKPTDSFAYTMSESSLPSFTLLSTLRVSPISRYISTSSASLEVSHSNDKINSTSMFNATFHSSMFATLPSTHTKISPNISTTLASSVFTSLPSSSAQITQGVYPTKVSSSITDFNASSFGNIATRTIFDTTLIDTTVASFSFDISMNSSFTQNSPEYNITASMNSSTAFPSATVTDVLDSLSVMKSQHSFSDYLSTKTTRNYLNITTLFPSPTLSSSILTTHSLFDLSESNFATSHKIVTRSLLEESSSLSRVTRTDSLSPTKIILTSTLDSTNISVLYPSPSILSTPTSSEQLSSSNVTLPASDNPVDSVTVLLTSTIVSTVPMTSLLLDSFGSESSIYVTITNTFIDTLSTIIFDSKFSLSMQTLFSDSLLSYYATPLLSPSTSAKTTTPNTTMLLFTDVSSMSVNTSENSISSFFASSNITSTSDFSISGFQSSINTLKSQSFLENATNSILSTAGSFLSSSFSSSYLTSDEIRTGQFSSMLTTGEYSDTFIDSSESMVSTAKSPIMEQSSTLATPELSATKSSSIPMLSSVVSHALTTILQILSTTKDAMSENGSTILTNFVSRTFDSELMTESSKTTLTLSHDSSFSSPPSVSPFLSNVVSSLIESSVHPRTYFSSILSMSPVVSRKPSSSELTIAVESSLESSRYSDTLFSVLPASTTTLVMSSADIKESTTPVDSKSLTPHTDTTGTELLTASSLFITQSDTITDIISSTIAPASMVESTINSTALPATISPTSSSYFVTNDSDNATSFVMSSMESINSTDVQSQNISLGNETSVTFSITLLLSSVVETVRVSSSIFNPTTEPPEITTVNITNIEEAFWVRTVLKIPRRVNITDPNFVKEMEGRLAEAYNEAFIRLKLIQEGKFEPLQRRRRKKRFSSSGEAAVHIHDLTRKKDSSTVTVVYAVENSGEIMTAQNAVTALQVLDDQELAIILRQVVDIKAETYGQTPEREEPTDDNFPLWMIGAIAGGAAAVVILLWIVICIYCKCCNRKDSDVEAEPELMSIIPESPKVKDSPLRPLPQTPVKKSIEQSTASQYSFKKTNNYKMSVADREPAEIIDERTILETPVRREPPPKPPQHSSPECSTNVTPVLPKRELAPPGVEKGRRNSKNSIGPSINELESRRESVLSKDRKTEISQLFQSTVSEDSDGVKEQIKAEKMKNKELLREKYGQDVDLCADNAHQYDSTERIMLDLPSTPIPSYVIANGTPPKKNLTNQRRHSDGVPQDGENLEEAKTRMHQLLDDAFSLISPRKRELFTHKRNSLPSNKSNTDPELPFSGYTNPAYSHSSSDYFETWSPYRASDQVALISMPHTLVSSVTKLGQKSDKRLTATKIGKRPASNLDILNTKAPAPQPSENKTSSLITMTKEPPEPILLRTKDDISNNRVNSINSRTRFSNLRPNNGKTQTSKLNSGLILNGSATSMSKPSSTDLSRNKKESVEMKPLNHDGWNTIRNHRLPDKNLRNKDELDVIQSIQPHERTDNLIKSLRDEIKSLSKPETEEDINKKPIRRKNRKVNKPMTDIM